MVSSVLGQVQACHEEFVSYNMKDVKSALENVARQKVHQSILVEEFRSQKKKSVEEQPSTMGGGPESEDDQPRVKAS